MLKALMKLPTILVVDDKPENLKAMNYVLGGMPILLKLVSSGQDAIAICLREDVALILLDVQMPEMCGFDVAEFLHHNEDTKNIPIIFVTAISQEKRYIKQGYNVGAVDYLLKPIDAEILLSKVRAFSELYDVKQNTEYLMRKYRLILDSTKDGILEIDNTGIISFCNNSAANILKESPVNLQGQPFQVVFEADKNYSTINKLKNHYISKCYQEGKILQVENSQMYDSTGQAVLVAYTATPIITNNITVGAVMVVENLGPQKALEEKVKHLSCYDALTQLPNRSLFQEHFANRIKTADDSRKIVILYIAVNNYKLINDTYGYSCGEQLIKAMAERICTILADVKSVAKFANNEFCAYLENVSKKDDVNRIVRDLINSITRKIIIEQHKIYPEINIGIDLYPDSSLELDVLAKNAGIAMRFAQEQAVNSSSWFERKMEEKISNKVKLENMLYKALKQDELELYYQPQISADKTTVCGAEALLRWIHPDKGEISPTVFIPIAEDKGIIYDLTTWVLRRSCRQLQRWMETILAENAQFNLSINISSKIFATSNILREMLDVTHKYRINPKNIEMEITESAIINNTHNIERLMQEIKNAEIHLSIDDFGTGYSSMQQLKKLAVDKIKIDKCFIDEITTNKKDRSIVQSIIQLSQGLGIEVVAEGVEKRSQETAIAALGPVITQGYLYSKPLPGEQFFIFYQNFGVNWPQQ